MLSLCFFDKFRVITILHFFRCSTGRICCTFSSSLSLFSMDPISGSGSSLQELCSSLRELIGPSEWEPEEGKHISGKYKIIVFFIILLLSLFKFYSNDVRYNRNFIIDIKVLCFQFWSFTSVQSDQSGYQTALSLPFPSGWLHLRQHSGHS